MATLTKIDVGKEVDRANKKFQPKSGECVATPALVRPLLEQLQAYTDEVQHEADEQGLTSDTNVAQFQRDMATWQFRLAEYFSELDRVPPSDQDTTTGCQVIYTTVVAPLLDGIYYTEAPGILLNQDELDRIRSGTGHSPGDDVTTPGHPEGHSNPKPPDVATPFMLGNQVLVYREWQAERWRLFWDDIIQGAKGLVPDPRSWPWWLKIAAGGTGAAVLAGLGYVVYRKIRPKTEANPPRKRRRRRRANPPGQPKSPPDLKVVK